MQDISHEDYRRYVRSIGNQYGFHLRPTVTSLINDAGEKYYVYSIDICARWSIGAYATTPWAKSMAMAVLNVLVKIKNRNAVVSDMTTKEKFDVLQ